MLKTYTKRAIGTATYPNKGSNIIYPILGLNDELGEAVEKILAFKNSIEQFEGIIDELGDILWYFNAIHYEFKIYCDSVNYTCYDFATLINMSKCAPCYCLAYDLTQDTIIKNLIVFISKITGIVKKAHRDNNNLIQPTKIGKFLEHFVSALSWYQKWIDYINYKNTTYTNSLLTIEQVGDRNIAKLEDRMRRNVIVGDGDKR